jgi:DNA (cytosine-5)-methyltransferase 1
MHNNNTIVPYISLCSGYEGIGLGLHRCIPNLRCIAYCEREAFATSNLVAKMEKGLLDEAPVFTDVTTFPWEQFAPYMAGGILSFGWPCQPVSMAGKRKATEDERWLFDIIADGISIMRPGMLFAENVEGLLSAKMPDGSSVFGHCIERLEKLHYKVEAGIFSASEVGAPHQRKRVFILAYSKCAGLERWISAMQSESNGCGTPSNIGKSGNLLVNAINYDGGNVSRNQRREEERSIISNSSSDVADTYNSGSRKDQLLSELWTTGIEQSPGGSRLSSESSKAREVTIWPSRPGQPQYAWEPPRVVANSKYDGFTSCQIGGSTCETIPEQQSWEDNSLNIERAGSIATAESDGMGYTQSRENNGRESRDMDEASGQRGCCDDATNGASESMGNSECVRFQGWGEQRAMGEESCIPSGEGCESSSSTQEPINTREREGSWRDESECGKIEQPMGNSTHGTESWLGISELSGLSNSELAEIREWMVKTDNRTDELRLLGNGVVKATATRAFLTLLEKLK